MNAEEYNWLGFSFSLVWLIAQFFGSPIVHFSNVWVWELDYKESWALKNWCFWIVVLEKTRESFGLQGDPTGPSQRKSVLNIHWTDWCWSWSFNTLATWCKEPNYWKRPNLIGKDPDAGKDWRQEEKGTSEDEMVRWHHWLNRREFEQAPEVGDG